MKTLQKSLVRIKNCQHNQRYAHAVQVAPLFQAFRQATSRETATDAGLALHDAPGAWATFTQSVSSEIGQTSECQSIDFYFRR
jgi:hypothetical protein